MYQLIYVIICSCIKVAGCNRRTSLRPLRFEACRTSPTESRTHRLSRMSRESRSWRTCGGCWALTETATARLPCSFSFTSQDTAMERNSSQLTSPPFRTMNSQKWSMICSQKMPHWLASLIVVMGQRCYNHFCPGISWHLERQSTEESRRNWTWDHPGWLCQAHKSVHSLLESTSEDVTCFSKSWTWDWKARSVSNVFKRRKYGTAARTQSTTCGTGTPFPTAERYVWSLKEPFWKDVTPKHQTSQSESIPTRVPAIIHLDGLNW